MTSCWDSLEFQVLRFQCSERILNLSDLVSDILHFLQLNKEKTEVIAFGNKDKVLKVNAYLDSRDQTKKQVKNLGVILETDLSFSSHVKAVTKSAYYHLKNIARIRSIISSQDLEKLVHASITSRSFGSWLLSPLACLVGDTSFPVISPT